MLRQASAEVGAAPTLPDGPPWGGGAVDGPGLEEFMTPKEPAMTALLMPGCTTPVVIGCPARTSCPLMSAEGSPIFSGIAATVTVCCV